MKREPLRIRLYKTKTMEELENMVQEIYADKSNFVSEFQISKRAGKLLDEISWAISYHNKRR
jgi:3-dehydroquinate dehydratase